RAAWSRALSPASGSDGIAVSGVEVLGAITGAGITGVEGTNHVGSSVGATAITAGAGIGRGAAAPDRSAREGVCAGAAPVAARALGLASALRLARGTIAAAP